MSHTIKKAAAVGFLVFLALWLVGVARGLTLPFPPPPPLPLLSISSGPERESSRYFQQANNLKDLKLIETPLPVVLDDPRIDKIRIFEKKAILTTGTSDFDADEAALRAAVKEHKASIFNERSGGIAPARHLTLEIGVDPERYEALVAKLRGIGQISTITVEQKDRTKEFRTLFSQRMSLKKNLESMLKQREGKTLSFDEMLRLEQIIQGLEKEAQALNLQFGDLLGKESFYHVHISLIEHQPGDRRDASYTVPQRIGHAFLWAIVWWFATALTAALIVGVALSVWMLRQKEKSQ